MARRDPATQHCYGRCSIDRARPTDITFIESGKYADALAGRAEPA